jgi:hypothetical protein
MTGRTLFAVGLGSRKIIVKNPCAETALFKQGSVSFDLIVVELFFAQTVVMLGINRSVFWRRFQKCKLTFFHLLFLHSLGSFLNNKNNPPPIKVW